MASLAGGARRRVAGASASASWSTAHQAARRLLRRHISHPLRVPPQRLCRRLHAEIRLYWKSWLVSPRDPGLRRAYRGHARRLPSHATSVLSVTESPTAIPQMPVAEHRISDCSPHKANLRRPAKSLARPWGCAEPRSEACDRCFRGVRAVPSRSGPHLACWVVVAHWSRSSCWERRRP